MPGELPSPRISVIVLTKNRPEVLRNCISSVLAQNYDSYELLILDDASKPELAVETLFSAERDPRIRLLHTPESLGVAGGRNLLMEASHGELIVSIDDDAVFTNRKALQLVAETFDASSTVAAVAFKIMNHVGGEKYPLIPFRKQKIRKHPEVTDRGAMVSSFRGGGHALRAAVIRTLGGYRRDMMFGEEEMDVAYRIIQRGWQIQYVPEILVDHFPQPSVVGAAGKKSRSELFYHTRNRAYLAYRYLPALYAIPYLGIWLTHYVLRGLREKALNDVIRGVVATPAFLSQVRREVLDRRAIHYLSQHDGRLWY